MKKIIACTLAAAGLFASGLAQAAGADLSVKGRLQTGACNVMVGGGGNFDLGTIEASNLKQHAFTELLPIVWQLPLSIDCSTPTRFALRLQDNRASTAIDDAFENSYGLGTAGGRKIGLFMAGILRPTSDGEAIEALKRNDESAPWGGHRYWSTVPGSLIGFTALGGSEPAAFQQVSAILDGQIILNKASELDLSQEIRLDGSATLELVYL